MNESNNLEKFNLESRSAEVRFELSRTPEGKEIRERLEKEYDRRIVVFKDVLAVLEIPEDSVVLSPPVLDRTDFGYTIVTTVPTDENQMPKEPGAINGGMLKRDKDYKCPVIVINVPSVDDYLTKVEQGGGRIVAPKHQVGDMGFYARVMDTEGNVIGIWQDLR